MENLILEIESSEKGNMVNDLEKQISVCKNEKVGADELQQILKNGLKNKELRLSNVEFSNN